MEKVNHQKRGGISDFREQCFGFSFARDVPFWRSNLQQRADGHTSPSGWENLYPNKLHDHPRGMAACKTARSSSSPASSLLCLRKASKASDATTSSCPRPWWYVGTPSLSCSPMGCQLQFLMEGKFVERYFSTAGQTTSSRSKLF